MIQPPKTKTQIMTNPTYPITQTLKRSTPNPKTLKLHLKLLLKNPQMASHHRTLTPKALIALDPPPSNNNLQNPHLQHP